MEKERRLNGRMIDDLHKLVERREQLHLSQTTSDSGSERNTTDSPDAPSITSNIFDQDSSGR
jgi:hypothetical protein